jgi:hypothetical protein
MKRNAIGPLALACLVLAGCASQTLLFDGSSLSGWETLGDADWRVRGGAIEAVGGGDGFLATRETFSSFDLFLEFHVDATTNSGVFIRCTDRGSVDPRSCYEINIYDQHPQQQARTGAIVLQVMPPLVHVDTIGRWNTLQVTARGPVLTVRVNGRITALMDDAEERAGFIALQHWQKGEVRFRNLRLDRLEVTGVN